MIICSLASNEYPNSLREKSDWLDATFSFIHGEIAFSAVANTILSEIFNWYRSYNLEPT